MVRIFYHDRYSDWLCSVSGAAVSAPVCASSSISGRAANRDKVVPVIGIVDAAYVNTLSGVRVYEIASADVHAGVIDIAMVALEIQPVANLPLAAIP